MRHRLTALALVAAALAGFAFAGPALYAAAVPSAQQSAGGFYFEGQLADDLAVTIDAQTTGITGMAPADLIAFAISCTEESGTATLDVALQRSVDGGATWADVVAMTQLSATGAETKLYADVRASSAQMIGDRLRVDFDVGGTGEYTCDAFLTAEG